MAGNYLSDHWLNIANTLLVLIKKNVLYYFTPVSVVTKRNILHKYVAPTHVKVHCALICRANSCSEYCCWQLNDNRSFVLWELTVSCKWLNITYTSLVLIKKTYYFTPVSVIAKRNILHTVLVCRTNQCNGSLRTYMSRKLMLWLLFLATKW